MTREIAESVLSAVADAYTAYLRACDTAKAEGIEIIGNPNTLHVFKGMIESGIQTERYPRKDYFLAEHYAKIRGIEFFEYEGGGK
jgi:predicted YcjX-like family ATPase